ncbi:hypothetical protein HY626_03810 [Candidatus Uhrbacteria bacterium]|nr:hypothetical protein [Candidatus Uhrbacteria bacterium]
MHPSDRLGLQKVIEINTFLWGGMYNPIIPAFQRTPRNWESPRFRRLPHPTDIVGGYLNAFDPDLVVPVGKCESRRFAVGHRDTVKIEEIIGDISDDGSPEYGIGFIDLLEDFVEKELKFARKEPLNVIFPKYGRAYRLFLSSVFGVLPTKVQQLVDLRFKSAIDLKSVGCTIEGFPDLFGWNNFFPRRLSSWGLGRPLRDPQLFVCDAKSTVDIIDYWNIRAAGCYVVPIPVQAAESDSVQSLAREFIEEHYRPYRHNPDIYDHAAVQKSRSLNEDTVREFCELLKIPADKKRNEHKYVVRPHYPRLWDPWASEHASEGVDFRHSHEVEVSIAEGQERVELRSQDPKLDVGHRYSGHPKFANEFVFRFSGAKEPMAEVFPEGSRELSSAIGRIHYREWRFSKSGPVFLASGSESLIFLDLPRAEAVMTEWFRERGWNVTLSGPGRMATQIVKQLGGIWGLTWLTHEGVVRLLQELEDETGIPRQAVVRRLEQVIKDDRLFFSAERFMERLLEFQALRLGAKVQCPICTRHNWFGLDQLDYTLRCRYCLSDFAPPLQSPRDMEWTYRAHGPFAISVAQGAFTVVLTLKFLDGFNHPGITPLFSYTAKRGDEVLEADLTCLYRPSGWRRTQTYVVHAECKSFNRFDQKDLARMNALAGAFPGSALIFSTMRSGLEADEVRMLSSLALGERRKRLRGKPYSPVIVLTATEIFSSHGAPMCWQDKGGLYKGLSEARNNMVEPRELADATQQLYLGLPSWTQWYEAKRKQKKAEK